MFHHENNVAQFHSKQSHVGQYVEHNSHQSRIVCDQLDDGHVNIREDRHNLDSSERNTWLH